MADSNLPASKVIGTAGHIDHGKTALIRALTGIDADRLPEEKRRGMTIDLGFAYLDLPPFGTVGIVDVPGHEGYIRNMLAGATGIDVALLVVAADDGVMPQTREHVDILRLLGVRNMVCAITKADLVDSETLQLAREDVKSFLEESGYPEAPVIVVSALKGSGLKELREALKQALARGRPARRGYAFRLPVDRSFAPLGIGCVVTGTVWSGEIRTGAEVQVLPQGAAARVRRIQCHNKTVEAVGAGRRAALNLAGVKAEEVQRGCVLVEPEAYGIWPYLNAYLTLLPDCAKPLRSFEEVRVHLGTAQTTARVVFPAGALLKPGRSSVCQLRLEKPLVATRGDRFVIRRETPARTLGGGEVLLPGEKKVRAKNTQAFEKLARLRDGGAREAVALAVAWHGARSPDPKRLSAMVNLPERELQEVLKELIEDGTLVALSSGAILHSEAAERLKLSILEGLGRLHARNPARSGIPFGELRGVLPKLPEDLLTGVLEILVNEGRVVSRRNSFALATHSPALTEEERRVREGILEAHRKNPFNPPGPSALAEALGVPQDSVAAQLKLLAEEGVLITLAQGVFLTAEAVQEAIETAKRLARERGAFAVMDFRDALGTTRKYAVPLLEYLDRMKITLRRPDSLRVLR